MLMDLAANKSHHMSCWLCTVQHKRSARFVLALMLFESWELRSLREREGGRERERWREGGR
jgi:hypothetical protein